MRRALLGLAVTALTVLALVGPASAASGQVTQFKYSGAYADSLWITRSATARTATSITLVSEGQGSGQTSRLYFDQFRANLYPNGNAADFTETRVDGATSGYSLTIPQSLARASLSGSGLPATIYYYDTALNLIGSSATTIDMNASWTGQGPVTRSVTNNQFKSDGFIETVHLSGTNRTATATGTAVGLTLTAADLLYASLGTTKEGVVTICIGGSC
jgi:hypothetical protein